MGLRGRKKQEDGENFILGIFMISRPYILTYFVKVILWRRIKWAGNLVLKGKKINVYRTLMGKPEGKNLFKRSRPRWEDIKIYSK
jgi:hypothetical protein